MSGGTEYAPDMWSRRGTKVLLIGGAALLASPGALAQENGEERRDLSELQRTKLLSAEERAALRRRAAEAAERVADELEATARELERLARSAEGVAAAARGRADDARERARAARAELASPAQEASPQAPGAGASGAPRTVLTTFEPEAAATMAARVLPAATRTSDENKAKFLPRVRAGRDWDPKVRTKMATVTYEAGAAPDIGDVDFLGEWQWALNVARGGVPDAGDVAAGAFKTGHVDLARLTIVPDPGAFGATGMKWGMRRYNLGDVTVTDCDFTGIPKEHGIYDSLSGHALYRGNTFLGIGGQAIQLAHRAAPYAQYGADNLPYTAPPLIIVEDCHAVDVGLDASRSAFAWTFFDPGSYAHPGTVILRGSTLVSDWASTRTSGGEVVDPGHPRALRSSGGLVLTHYADAPDEPEGFPTRDLVVDACLFDLTMGEQPVAAVRGVETIHLEDSVFIARDHRRPYFDVDDAGGSRSGRVVIQNCVSPPGSEVWLRIRGRKVMSLHTPGKRFEIDVETGRIIEFELRDTPLTRVVSPLASRTVRPGVHPQPAGHVDDLGVLDDAAIR